MKPSYGAYENYINDIYGTEASLYKKYIDTDIASIHSAYEQYNKSSNIKNVIFNDPATIVFWYDGTKTVVKAKGDDIFDPEKGLAMAIAKKAMGNKGNYYNELKKWLPEEEKTLPGRPSCLFCIYADEWINNPSCLGCFGTPDRPNFKSNGDHEHE